MKGLGGARGWGRKKGNRKRSKEGEHRILKQLIMNRPYPPSQDGALLVDHMWSDVTGRAAVASPSPYVIPAASAAAAAAEG